MDNWSGNPKTWVDGAPAVTAADFNVEIRDRFDALKAGLVGDASTDADIVQRIKMGTAAARPAAGEAGRLYYATDTKTWSIDNGTTWDRINQVVRKTTQEIISSQTLLQDDNELFLALAANEKLVFEALLFVEGPAGADIKIGFTVPTGATIIWSGIGLISTAADTGQLGTSTAIQTSGGSIIWGLLGGGAVIPVRLWGTVVNGANAGNLQLQFAQAVSDGSGIAINANSWLKGQTVA